MKQQKIDVINDAFLVNILTTISEKNERMTATEIIERTRERGQMITPLVGRQQAEFLQPLIERELGIMRRQGDMPEPPASLEDDEFEIRYETDATRMQMSEQVAAFQRLTEVMIPYANADPAVIQGVDADEAYRHFGQVLGVPARVFRDEREMDNIRKGQAQQQAAASAAEAAPGLAEAVKVASEIDAG